MTISLDELEDRIFNDIARARGSYSLIKNFLQPLYKNAPPRRYAAIFNAVWRSAYDSLITSLGRLLQRSGEIDECTLARYKNAVIKELKTNGPKRNESANSIKCYKQLIDNKFVNKLKSQQKRFADVILPVRDKIIAHHDVKAELGLIQKTDSALDDCIVFIEDAHRVCHAALNDTGMPGEYLPATFEMEAKRLIELLAADHHRQRGQSPMKRTG